MLLEANFLQRWYFQPNNVFMEFYSRKVQNVGRAMYIHEQKNHFQKKIKLVLNSKFGVFKLHVLFYSILFYSILVILANFLQTGGILDLKWWPSNWRSWSLSFLQELCSRNILKLIQKYIAEYISKAPLPHHRGEGVLPWLSNGDMPWRNTASN